MGKFEIKEAKTGFMFNLKAGNGEIIGTSEIYSSMAACKNGVQSVKNNAEKANIEDQTKQEETKCPKFEIYNDKRGEFRFRLKATNGENILKSEGYTAKANCIKGIESVIKNSKDA